MKAIKPKDIEIVINEAIGKYKKGRDKYGSLALVRDKRNFINEAEQELLDCINYCVFQILRLRGIKKP
ncbi:MAG: hypothetical protein HY265_04440 [Deltaproteobacteria bacterium]|nr:hypothetical protein [Deltaproteobacteria bacterium]